MREERILREQELFDIPNTRLAICLVLDTSGSMEGDNINELNQGVDLLMNTLKKDKNTKFSTEIAVVTFGGQAKKILDFGIVANQNIPVLGASGQTPMNEAVNLALDLLETRKNEYKKAGVDYYQPWMVLMTDGLPDVDPLTSSKKTADLVKQKKLTVLPIGIGKHVDMDTLKKFSPTKPPLKLRGLNFHDFFEWLAASASRLSQSRVGEEFSFDVQKMSAWASL